LAAVAMAQLSPPLSRVSTTCRHTGSSGVPQWKWPMVRQARIKRRQATCG
jgi:hypothetical protein